MKNPLNSLLDTLSACLSDGLPQAWVLELSSFQLNDTEGFEPTAATVLNITQDHLDWHGDLPAYAAAKGRVFGTTGLRVLRRDDPLVAAWRVEPPAPSRRADASPAPVPECITFGPDVPQRPGDYGLASVYGMTWLVRALPDRTATVVAVRISSVRGRCPPRQSHHRAARADKRDDS